VPSIKIVTAVTPTLSLAEAVTLTVPDTVAPLAGAVMLIVGSVVSGGRLLTVTLTTGAVPVLPAASVAVAEIVCDALVVVVVSQEQE